MYIYIYKQYPECSAKISGVFAVIKNLSNRTRIKNLNFLQLVMNSYLHELKK